METIDWTKAEPIDVEREVRRRLKKPAIFRCDRCKGEICDECNGPDIYIWNLVSVMRDVLPVMRCLAPQQNVNHITMMHFENGCGCLHVVWMDCDPRDHSNEWEVHDKLADWNTLDAAPLAICRAFCLMEEST